MSSEMIFSDLALSRRLEHAEGNACMEFARARKRLFPESGAEWIKCGGAYAVFDGVESPITQTFGLGIFEELSVGTLDTIENFFHDRGAPVFHEVSPLAGTAAFDLLCIRGYRPMEISSVLYRPVTPPDGPDNTTGRSNITVRVTGPDEAVLWSEINSRGWSHEHPELETFLRELGLLASAREQSICFLGEIDGRPGAAAMLSLHEGVALFGGSATIPELRCKGLHAALLEERMCWAFEHGCDLAMMVALAGSESQRNAERKGFRIAYTRMKWQLFSE